jgi:4-hydroxy-4-methyl-2-oxoglutarate aldolase
MTARLSTPLVSDALDGLGYRNQALGWDIAAMTSPGPICGPAFPVRLERAQRVPDVPYVGLIAALDVVHPGSVFVFPTFRATDVAVWGELLSTVCIERGAIGALTDGLVRDTPAVRKLGFPVWARGTLPADINGRFEVVAHDVAADIDGVHIEPGDLIVADEDGVVVVPVDIAEDVAQCVADKAVGESHFRRSVRDGMSASAAYAKWGVL